MSGDADVAPPSQRPRVAQPVRTRVLQPEQWRELEQRHQQRVRPLVQPRLRRRQQGGKHPVDDFLFEYYRLRPAQLLAWHPGWRWEAVDHPRLRDDPSYELRTRGWGASPTVLHRRQQRWQRSIRILRATAARPASFGCFGMHEWAMVYRTEKLRHPQVPLRVGPGRIAEVVDDVGLRCTHFDAYRFFTDAARPRQQQLTRDRQEASEQPGCVHAGMDLYRYAYEALPALPSALVADCFEFARDARELDMRASPYDLSQWDLEPIEVDTPAGRRHYVAHQRRLAQRAAPLRAQVLAELEAAAGWIRPSGGTATQIA